MTEKEFICNALLQLIGNSVYARCSWSDRESWKDSIQYALDAAIEIAEHYGCLDEEPDDPP